MITRCYPRLATIAPQSERTPPRLPPGPMARAASASAKVPGTYIHHCRQKAGWSLDELALVLSGSPGDRPAMLERLRELEDKPHHTVPVEGQLRARLVEYIALDSETYLALVAAAQLGQAA